jgi:hypothetical protein
MPLGAELRLRAILHSADFFCTERRQNTNVSALVPVIKSTIYQKRTNGDLAYLMAVK